VSINAFLHDVVEFPLKVQICRVLETNKSTVRTNEQNNSILFLLFIPYLFFVRVRAVSANGKVECVNRWVLKRGNLTFSFLSSWILSTFWSLSLPISLSLLSCPVWMKENVLTSIRFCLLIPLTIPLHETWFWTVCLSRLHMDYFQKESISNRVSKNQFKGSMM
jgi:hypothetical protein